MWIITAWQHISPEMTVKGFKMCCISNVMVGTDNDMLWNSSEEDGNIRGECEEDKGTNFEDENSDSGW
jgi:hypothetical protein